MRDQFDALRDTDWDVLLVLDACRWDTWRDKYGHGDPVWSPASCTLEWTRFMADEYGETLCVTANPTHAKHHDEAFPNRVDVWQTEWQQYNGIPTVSPRDTTERALEAWDRSERLYVHYIQPHGPYPWSDPPISLTRANPLATMEHVKMPSGLSNKLITNPKLAFVEFEWLTPELLKEAYERNLGWVRDALLPFEDMDKRVVVTSDHGEWLCDGVGQPYGHPCGEVDEVLRQVPFWVIGE